jgi:hypothetical protein
VASKKLSEMTDEERYGKVGAEIRRLDPEAYKNRPRSMEGNLKLLKELRAKGKETPASAAPATPAAPIPKGPTSRGGRRASAEETEASNRRIEDQMIAKRATAAMERNRSALPSDRATNFRTQAEETGMDAEQRAAKARGYAKDIAMTAGAGKLVSLARTPYVRRAALDKAAEMEGKILARKGVPSYSERYRASESAAARRAASPKRRREEAERMLDEKLSSDMAGGYKRGGKVKSSASSRADGIAKRGRTRGRYI